MRSEGTALHPPRMKRAVAARPFGGLITIASAEIKCPNSLETMCIHLSFLKVGLGIV